MTQGEMLVVGKIYDKLEEMKNVNETFLKGLREKSPINLEADILKSIQQTLQTAIIDNLSKSYNNPLHRLVDEVVLKHSREIIDMVEDSFKTALSDGNFKTSIQEAINHKMGRSLISLSESMLDKITNEIKNDSVFKSKIKIAIDGVIKEYQNEKM